MKRNDTTFKLMVSRLQSGEITREQACAEYGVGYGTLCVWLGRSKLNATIPHPGWKPDRARPMVGAAAEWTPLDEDTKKAIEAAVVRVIAGEISALAVAKEDPRINHRTLTKAVRKAKIAAGIPVRVNKSRYADSA